jgi:uncharacterized protein YndB with AHSA1/START domain
MDIHHAMIVRNNSPDRLYAALTQPRDLEAWMGAPTIIQPEVIDRIEFHFDQGQRTLIVEVTRLEAGKLVQWQIIQPVWETQATHQTVT